MWRPTTEKKLYERISGQLLSLTNIILRKKWAFQFSEMISILFNIGSGVPVDFIRFVMDDNQFASVNRALIYRLFSSPRDCSQDLKHQLDSTINAMETLINNHGYFKGGLILRNQMLAKVYLDFSFRAFSKYETQLGQESIRRSIHLDRTILDTQAQKYREFLIQNSICDSEDHESLLRQVFEQLPPELAWITQYCDDTVARSYLFLGAQAIMWGRQEKGEIYLEKAQSIGARLNKPILLVLLEKLSDYEAEFGTKVSETVLKDWTYHLKIVGSNADLRWLKTTYMLNRAFEVYEWGHYESVPICVLRAAWSKPTRLANRGVLSIFFRSLINTATKKSKRVL
jgi:hypothetical protein